MLYLHETLTIVPWTEDEFWHVMGTDYVSQVERQGLRLVGLFKVGIRYSENIAIWEVDDWAALDRIQEFHDLDPWMQTWKLESIGYRTDWIHRILEPTNFSPTLSQILEEDYKSTFYLHCMAQILPGKVSAYTESIEKDMIPMAEKWGMKLAGCYQTAAGEADSNEVIHIWTAGDMIAGWDVIRNAACKDPNLKEWDTKAGIWQEDMSYKFLLGLVPYSPLRMKDEFLQAVQLMKKRE